MTFMLYCLAGLFLLLAVYAFALFFAEIAQASAAETDESLAESAREVGAKCL